MESKKWFAIIGTIVIIVGGFTVYLTSSGFEIKLSDGSVKAKYDDGLLKVYSGRYLAYSEEVRPYYWNGEGYVKMYKDRGEKYGSVEYFFNDAPVNESVELGEGDSLFVKQPIFYSQGVLIRYFEIDEYGIKSSFKWVPDEDGLRTYFNIVYGDLDEWKDKVVYVDSTHKAGFALMDFGMVNTWWHDLDKIVRAERFQNGKLYVRTKVFEGVAVFDPEIIVDVSKDRTFLKKEVVDDKIVSEYTGLEISLDKSVSCLQIYDAGFEKSGKAPVCFADVTTNNSLALMKGLKEGIVGDVDGFELFEYSWVVSNESVLVDNASCWNETNDFNETMGVCGGGVYEIVVDDSRWGSPLKPFSGSVKLGEQKYQLRFSPKKVNETVRECVEFVRSKDGLFSEECSEWSERVVTGYKGVGVFNMSLGGLTVG